MVKILIMGAYSKLIYEEIELNFLTEAIKGYKWLYDNKPWWVDANKEVIHTIIYVPYI